MYEFTPEENHLLSALSSKMKVVGIFAMIIGAVDTYLAIYWLVTTTWGSAIEHAVQAVMFILMGIWIYKAATSFKQIVLTEGNDIQNLMKALSDFQRLFTLLYSLLIFFLLFTILNAVIRALLTYL